eukprot:scaffold1590_cov417-Prasinococcus_capsulatus_cf.AAC.14
MPGCCAVRHQHLPHEEEEEEGRGGGGGGEEAAAVIVVAVVTVRLARSSRAACAVPRAYDDAAPLGDRYGRRGEADKTCHVVVLSVHV